MTLSGSMAGSRGKSKNKYILLHLSYTVNDQVYLEYNSRKDC